MMMIIMLTAFDVLC